MAVVLPIIDYPTLVAAVIAWCERTDLADVVPVCIALAERRMTRDLRVRQMIHRSTAPAIVGTEYVDLPDDFIEMKRIRPITVPPSLGLRYLTPSQMDDQLALNDSSKPLPGYFTLEGNQIRLANAPTADGVYEIVYYGDNAPITALTPQNWLILKWPDAYLYGTLTEVAPYLRDDDRLPMWKGIFEEKVNEIQAADERAEKAGGPMRARTGALV